MSKIRFFIFLFALCLSGGCSDSLLNGDEETGKLSLTAGLAWPGVSDAYTYPAGPFRSHDEFMEAQQVPSDLLSKMSTSGVIYSFVNAPGLPGLFLASSASPIETFYRMYDEQFNSAKAILRRFDSGEALFAFYKSIGWDCTASMDEAEQWYFSIRIRALECMFTRGEILRQFSLKGKKNIVKQVLSNYKQSTDRLPGTISDAPAVMALILYDARYAPLVAYYKNNDVDIENPSDFYVFTNQESDIIAFAESFIK
jgi:hypothetical protein